VTTTVTSTRDLSTMHLTYLDCFVLHHLDICFVSPLFDTGVDYLNIFLPCSSSLRRRPERHHGHPHFAHVVGRQPLKRLIIVRNRRRHVDDAAWEEDCGEGLWEELKKGSVAGAAWGGIAGGTYEGTCCRGGLGKGWLEGLLEELTKGHVAGAAWLEDCGR
jgi:hypothetical protein